jgi:hypothetical protein
VGNCNGCAIGRNSAKSNMDARFVVFIQQVPAIEIRNGIWCDAPMSSSDGLIIQKKMEPVRFSFSPRTGFYFNKKVLRQYACDMMI